MPFGMIGSMFSSIVGAASQSETNQSNMDINQMNNEFNAREAEKAFRRETEYNDRIRAEDRAYNSASAQVERYRQAGLNPTLMMQGQGAGVAQSNGASSPSASSSGNATMQAYQPHIDASGLNGAVLGYLDLRQRKELQDEQINGLRIENQYKAQQIMAQIAKTYSEKMSHDARAKLDRTLEGLQNQIVRNQTITAESQARQQNESAELMIAERLLKSKELSTFDAKFRQEAAIRVAQALNYSNNARLSEQQRRHEVYKQLYTMYQAQGVKDANHVARRTADAIVDKAYNDARLSRKNARSFMFGGVDVGGAAHVLNEAFGF